MNGQGTEMSDNEKQDKPLHGPNLILDVENFGPIAEAKEIEFRPMTVFVGPSNTGKSYLAMLLHAMLEGHRPYKGYNPFNGRFRHFEAMSLESAKELAQSATDLMVAEPRNDDVPFHVDLRKTSTRLRDEIQSKAEVVIRDLARDCGRTIADFFEVDDIDQLQTANGMPGNNLAATLRGTSLDPGLAWSVSTDSDSPSSELDIAGLTIGIDPHMVGFLDDLLEDDDERQYLMRRIGVSVGIAIRSVFASTPNSIYFPASRTGILTSHATLTDSIVANARRFAVENVEVVPYHRMTSDFLRMINDMDEARPRPNSRGRGVAGEIAQEIEDSLISGRIVVDRASVGLPNFYYESSQGRHPMFRSSSMVTEVAPIVMFLRKYMTLGDLLVIEEPESHLHPAAQQKMAAVLALLIRKGFRVLITTHSHYMVEQLGTFINASFADPGRRARQLNSLGADVDRELYLKEDEVAVYDFTKKLEPSAGTVVERLEMDEETFCFYPDGYTDALNAQHNRSVNMIAARGGF